MDDISTMLRENSFVRNLMDCLPCGVIVVDEGGRVKALNSVLQNAVGVTEPGVLGKGSGNALGCVRASEHPKGCGTEECCNYCELRMLGLSVLYGTKKQRTSVSLQLVIDGQIRDVALLLSAVPFTYFEKRYAILIIEDITPLKSISAPDTQSEFRGILGQDEKIKNLFDTIRQIARTDSPVLLQGETGTGKGLAALAIHKESPRSRKYFVPVNCGSMPENLVETDLFGHVKGAFTGAYRDKKGRFELAHEGTIFLDEVSELKPAAQSKLLRVLEDGNIERVGSERPVRVNVRVISATNKELEKEVAAGRFRQDLYYRLCVMPIFIPPLRDRMGDLSLLVNHFLTLYSEESFGKRVPLSSKALSMLKTYRWPGNVRELQNILRFALTRSQGHKIEPQHLSPTLQLSRFEPSALRRRKSKLQSADVADVLKKAGGNKMKAAKLLGVSRSTLYRFFAKQKKIQ